MKKPTNPFAILGLNPFILKGLNDENIQLLIQSQYRTLQKIHHPDHGGNQQISSEINSAYNALTGNDFIHYKEMFLRERKGKKDDSKQDKYLADLQENARRTYSQFMDYLKDLAEPSENSVFQLRNCVLNMQDYLLTAQLHDISNYCVPNRKKKSCFYDLVVDNNGNLAKVQNNNRIELPGKKLIGVVDDETITKYCGKKNVLGLVQKVFDANKIERYFPKYREDVYFDNRITPELFFPVALLLTPEVKKHSMLFSLNKDNLGQFFSLEGLVVNIHK